MKAGEPHTWPQQGFCWILQGVGKLVSGETPSDALLYSPFLAGENKLPISTGKSGGDVISKSLSFTGYMIMVKREISGAFHLFRLHSPVLDSEGSLGSLAASSFSPGWISTERPKSANFRVLNVITRPRFPTFWGVVCNE